MSDEEQEPEAEEQVDADVFAELTAQSGDGGVSVHVWSRGRNPLPGAWVGLSASLAPADGAWNQELAVPALGNVAVAPGEAHTVTVPVEGYADGSYRVDVKLWVRDDRDRDVCFDESYVYLSVVGGRAGAYRQDPIADAELGDEFEGPGGGEIRFDPLPYLSDGDLVVTFVVDGPGTIPAGTDIGIEFHQHESRHTDRARTEREVPSGQSYSRTIALPAFEQGNHPAWVSVGTTSQVVTICYQDGPVEVLHS